MRLAAVSLGVFCLFAALPLHAEPVPEAVLQQDYLSCMADATPQSDPQRNEYCNCVRDSMRTWDLDTYGNIAMEQTKASNAQQVSGKIQEIAKACIAKILK